VAISAIWSAMKQYLRQFNDITGVAGQAAWDLRKHFAVWLGASSAVASLLSYLFPEHSTLLWRIDALLLVIYIAGAITLSILKGEAGVEGLEKRKFLAIPYSESTDLDLAQLTAFATECFRGNTLSAEAVRRAVRNGSIIGLRLVEDGRNIGFLDLMHFRGEAMTKWETGELDERAMQIEEFEPIGASDLAKPIKLAVGALLVRQPIFAADRHLTEAFVYAGLAYFEQALREHSEVEIYASIFNEKGGKYWAEVIGFERCRHKADRIGPGREHDLYRLKLTDIRTAKRTPHREEFIGIGRSYEFVVKLDAFACNIPTGVSPRTAELQPSS
jgi:hypothetical protein